MQRPNTHVSGAYIALLYVAGIVSGLFGLTGLSVALRGGVAHMIIGVMLGSIFLVPAVFLLRRATRYERANRGSMPRRAVVPRQQARSIAPAPSASPQPAQPQPVGPPGVDDEHSGLGKFLLLVALALGLVGVVVVPSCMGMFGAVVTLGTQPAGAMAHQVTGSTEWLAWIAFVIFLAVAGLGLLLSSRADERGGFKRLLAHISLDTGASRAKDQRSKFSCGQCGAEVAPTEESCPRCGYRFQSDS